VYNYGWGYNATECDKNRAFTVGNICVYIGFMATSDKPSGTGNRKFVERWTMKMHK
jgi:hypothetical protein